MAAGFDSFDKELISRVGRGIGFIAAVSIIGMYTSTGFVTYSVSLIVRVHPENNKISEKAKMK